MTTTSQKTKSAKPSSKVKTLSPRKDPKGGVKRRGDCDEFGCGRNHNEVIVRGGWS
jgi:hypothetical protein